LTGIVQRLSNYDFTFDENSKAVQYLKRKDEVGQITNALATMQTNIIELIKTINDKSEQVAAASEELSANTEENTSAANEVSRAVEDIANGATNQSQDTEGAMQNMDQFGTLIEKDQGYVTELNDKAGRVDELKEEGLHTVDQLVQKNKESDQAAQGIFTAVKNVSANASEIQQAIGMIKDIADQTNLLALNASIEAARAGEFGQGFAVVADEIRKLAEQSNEYSDNIAEVINKLTRETQNTEKIMDEVGEIVEEESQGVLETSEKFQGIAEAVQDMRTTIEKLNESGSQMQERKKELTDKLQGLSTVAEENSSTTEEISASVEEQTASMEDIAKSSEHLAKLAEEMQQEIARFKY